MRATFFGDGEDAYRRFAGGRQRSRLRPEHPAAQILRRPLDPVPKVCAFADGGCGGEARCSIAMAALFATAVQANWTRSPVLIAWWSYASGATRSRNAAGA